MTAPVPAYVQLPNDGTYFGKAVRTVRRLVGSNIVDQHVYATAPRQAIKGLYYFDSGVPSAIVATAHNGTTTGLLWMQNPSASAKLRLRRLEVAFTNATATAIVHDTAPRVAFALGTFTGTFAGATLTPTKRATADATNAGDIRTAVTGATVALGNIFWAALTPGNDITGPADVLNVHYGNRWDWGDDDNTSEDEFIVLAQNECLIAYQADNGTTNDQRLVQIRGFWDEIDIT